MLAVAYDRETEETSAGWNFAKRSYFHGGSGDLDLPYETAPVNVAPIRETHLSAAYRSSTRGNWRVAVSTPIVRPGSPEVVEGVMALTINLGDFAYFRSDGQRDQFAALIDGRKGPNFGVILQHPLLDLLNQDRMQPEEDFSATKYRITPEQLERIQNDPDYQLRYQDPLANAAGGESYRTDWIAAIDYVRLPHGSEMREDMIVLIQERFDEAIDPVRELGQRLKQAGLWALAGVISVILVVWYIVFRMFSKAESDLQPVLEKASALPLAIQTTIPTRSRDKT